MNIDVVIIGLILILSALYALFNIFGVVGARLWNSINCNILRPAQAKTTKTKRKVCISEHKVQSTFYINSCW